MLSLYKQHPLTFSEQLILRIAFERADFSMVNLLVTLALARSLGIPRHILEGTETRYSSWRSLAE